MESTDQHHPDDAVRLDSVSRTYGSERHRAVALDRVPVGFALRTFTAVVSGDEPTGALDTRAASEILQLLRTAVHEGCRTAVMVTHDPVATPERIAEQMTHLGEPAGQVAP
ncbi:hypothetical protein [Kitasatospora phosalacinea]|uniref:ABC transporter ATP-binding protein n=1 Tax=Kitasatospora phosalacinea TaxID=2065 RepID=A0ABW6GU34_9ACTN